MSIEQAAAAFQADMGGGKVMSSQPGIQERSAPEPIFGGSDEIIGDEIAGGDAVPTEEESKARREAKKANKREDDVDLDDVDPDEEVDPDGDADPDEEEDEKTAKKKGEEEDEDDDLDADPVLKKKFAVDVGGEEVEITVDEAIKSFASQEAIRRRAEFLEEGRQQVVQEGRNVLALRAKADEMLADVEEVLKSIIPAEPNWDELFVKDPKGARELQKQYEGLRGKVKEISDKRAANQKEANEQSEAELRKYKVEEARKFANTVKWRDRGEMEKDLKSMQRTAAAAGFSEEEYKQVYDSRMLIILRKASKYDRMVANKPKPVNTTRQQQPSDKAPRGNPRSAAPKANGRAMENLRKTGSIEAATSVFHEIINRKGR